MITHSTALITGASEGIGAVYADRLARRGHDLILVARHEDGLRRVADRIIAGTRRLVTVMVADLTNEADLARVEHALRTDATIDVLVNNAGSAMIGDLSTMDPVHLESMIRLNVLAPTRLAAAVVRQFVARRRGTVINLSSAVALAPEWFNAAYSGTKAYMLNLSMRLQQEVAGKGIHVQVVLPGVVRTGIWAKAGTDLGGLPADILMDPGEMVDAALAGLDNGELVTIPSLPDAAEWEAFEAAREYLVPKLSHSTPAARYSVAITTAAGAQ